MINLNAMISSQQSQCQYSVIYWFSCVTEKLHERDHNKMPYNILFHS